MYQKYRKAMYPASLGLAAELTDTYDIPAFISGAGPAVTAILDEDMFSSFKDIRGRITSGYLSFQSMVTKISEEGSSYI
jgi:homoserine kinase